MLDNSLGIRSDPGVSLIVVETDILMLVITILTTGVKLERVRFVWYSKISFIICATVNTLGREETDFYRGLNTVFSTSGVLSQKLGAPGTLCDTHNNGSSLVYFR